MTLVSTLDSRSSSQSSSTGQGHCVVFGQDILTLAVRMNAYWQLDKMLGVTRGGLASHPGGVGILVVGFMLQKSGKAPAAVGL